MPLMKGSVLTPLLPIAAVVFVLVLAPGPASADFYARTDASGTLHITNIPTGGGYVMIMRETGKARVRGGAQRRAIERIAREKARRYGVDPALVVALIRAESGFRPAARSQRGAVGLMQLMPETARELGVRDPADPVQNIDGGVRYLARLLRLFGREKSLAIAAYNAGEDAVMRYGAVPPFEETRSYVRRVLRYYDELRGR